MGNLYTTSNEAKTLEIEDTDREGHPFRMVARSYRLSQCRQRQAAKAPEALRRSAGFVWVEACYGVR